MARYVAIIGSAAPSGRQHRHAIAAPGIMGMELTWKGGDSMLRRLTTPLLLVALLLGSLAATSVAADAATIQGPNGAYSFTLPDGWQANPPDALGLTITNTANGTTLLISSSPTNGIPLDDQMQQGVILASQFPGYEAGANGATDVMLGGQPAKAFTFHSNDLVSGKPLSSAQIVVINKDTVYSLYFETARENENASDADIATMLNSWQFM
jgi:hypothetical protein